MGGFQEIRRILPEQQFASNWATQFLVVPRAHRRPYSENDVRFELIPAAATSPLRSKPLNERYRNYTHHARVDECDVLELIPSQES